MVLSSGSHWMQNHKFGFVGKNRKKMKIAVDISSGICYYNIRPVRTGHGLLKKFKNKIKKVVDKQNNI